MTESKSGRRAHRARVVVDASGDGDVFAGVGEPFDREVVHPWLWFRMGNVETPDDAMEAMAGRFFQTLGGRFFRTIGEGRTLMPWGIADVVDRKIDPTVEEDLTFAELECRRRVMEVVDRLRAEEPGVRPRLPVRHRLAARHLRVAPAARPLRDESRRRGPRRSTTRSPSPAIGCATG